MTDFGTGLRGLVGAGRSRLSLSAATRARDLDRPSAAELAAAELEIDRRLAGRSLGGGTPTAGGPTGNAAAGTGATAGSSVAGTSGAGLHPGPGRSGDRRRPAGPARGAPTPADIDARRTHEPAPDTEREITTGSDDAVAMTTAAEDDAEPAGERRRGRHRGSASRKGRRRGGHGSGDQGRDHGSGGSSPSDS